MPKKQRHECSYHPCKSRDNLEECRFCHRLFCEKHLKPYSPSTGQRHRLLKYSNSHPGVIKYPMRAELESSNSTGKGHPCTVYVDYLIQKSEDRNKRYNKTLDWILRPKRELPYQESSQQNSADECGYHVCHNTENLEKCMHCYKRFCPIHLDPYSPHVGIGGSRNRDKGGHPCAPFAETKVQIENEKNEDYGRALDDILRRPRRKPLSSPNLGVILFVLVSLFVAAYIFVPEFRDSVNGGINNLLTKNQNVDTSFSVTTTSTPTIVITTSTTTTTQSFKPSYDTLQIEQTIHSLINKEREKVGLNILMFDDDLASIARAHSTDMGLRNFFAHNNPDGKDPTARGVAAGYSCYKSYGGYYTTGIAENIFQTYTYSQVTTWNGVIKTYDWLTGDEIAAQIVTGLMNSPGHKTNILTATYDREGIGIAIMDDGKVLVTEDFC